MSTEFTLYALDEADLPAARVLGDANLAAVERIGFDGMMRAAAQRDALASVFDVYERASFVVDRDHTSLHGDVPCLAHDLVALIGHDMPLLDRALARDVLALWDRVRTKINDPDRVRLQGWLEGARGRHLWYEFI